MAFVSTLRSYAFAAASWACAILAISFPSFWFLAPFAAGFFLYDLCCLLNLRSALWRGFLFGLASGGAGIWWFWGTLPFDWVGLQFKSLQWYFVLAAWGEVTLTFALVTAIFAALMWRLRSLPFLPIVLALLWIAMEEARMWGFALLTYGPRSLMGPHFSSQALGYALAENHYLLQLAEGGGIYFLDFVVALMGGVLAAILLMRRIPGLKLKWGAAASAGILALILLVPLFHHSNAPTGNALRVTLVTTDLPLTPTLVDTTIFEDTLRQVASESPAPDVVVFPEEYRLEKAFPDASSKTAFYQSILGSRDMLLLDSHHTQAKGKGVDTTLAFENARGETLGTYSKRFLMPAGEYMPWVLTTAFSLLPDHGVANWTGHLATATPAYTDLTAVPFKGWRLGALICSDFLSPHLYRELATKSHADILLNLANPAWFHHSRLLYWKTVEISKVHAVQNRAYFLQATNGSPSFAIDPSGELMAQTEWGYVGPMTVSIPGT